jgi:hypothetical protein
MSDPMPVPPATPGEFDAIPSTACLRCRSTLRDEGPIDIRVGGKSGGWGLLLGQWADVGENLLRLDLLSCPTCGHVEFRVPTA